MQIYYTKISTASPGQVQFRYGSFIPPITDITHMISLVRLLRAVITGLKSISARGPTFPSQRQPLQPFSDTARGVEMFEKMVCVITSEEFMVWIMRNQAFH